MPERLFEAGRGMSDDPEAQWDGIGRRDGRTIAECLDCFDDRCIGRNVERLAYGVARIAARRGISNRGYPV
jgi:hypothetical protein